MQQGGGGKIAAGFGSIVFKEISFGTYCEGDQLMVGERKVVPWAKDTPQREGTRSRGGRRLLDL